MARYSSEENAKLVPEMAPNANENGEVGHSDEKDTDNLKDLNYPFQNIVLEGGGSKGLAYVGALEVLEEVGVLPKINRFCGASAGAIVATLLAVGYDSKKLREFLNQDMKPILIDHRFGVLSLLPNLLKGFGWNPGKKLLKWFGEVLEEATENADITFSQIYKKFGKELCIVVTNLSRMDTEYLHPKTSPDMPVKKAVRMSMSIPGLFRTVRHKKYSEKDIYIDGGFLCNYPIHVFDGWWLSMKPEHSFFRKYQNPEEYSRLYQKSARFSEWSAETIGFLLFSNSETELMKEKLSHRPGNIIPARPEKSKLLRKRRKKQEKIKKINENHKNIIGAVGRFLKDLVSMGFDQDGVITIDELEEAFEKPEEFTMEDRKELFETTDFNEAFEGMDKNEDGQVTFPEIEEFLFKKKGVDLQEEALGYQRTNITSFQEFLITLQTSLQINVKRHYVVDEDIERTIGIDTDYIETTDFDLEQVDKEFLVEVLLKTLHKN